MRRLLVLSTILTLCLPGISRAEDLPLPRDAEGWFVRTRAMAGVSHAAGEFSVLPPGTTDSEEVSADPQAYFGVGAGIGYRWQGWGIPLRAVVDGSLNFRHDTDVSAELPGGTLAYENNLRVWDFRVSLLADVLRFGWGSVYVGAGLGAARLESEVEIEAHPLVEESSDWRASPSLEAGIVFDGVFERVIPELSYRFRWLGDTKSGEFPDGERLAYSDAYVHDLAIGFIVPLGAQQARASGVMPAPARSTYDWTGFYVGAFGGWAWSDSVDATEFGPAGFVAPEKIGSFGADGFFGGAQIGVDRQWWRFVVGLGAEGGLLDLDGTVADSSPGGGDDTSFDTGAYVGLTVRGGLAFDRLLVFGRGGIAFLDAAASGVCDDPVCGSVPVEASESDVLLGHSVGGGLEYAFGRRWTAGAEYRFIHFFDDLQPQGGEGPGAPFWQNVHIDDIHTVRGQISYRW